MQRFHIQNLPYWNLQHCKTSTSTACDVVSPFITWDSSLFGWIGTSFYVIFDKYIIANDKGNIADPTANIKALLAERLRPGQVRDGLAKQ